jgi:capsular exopolysaccharide synthesis family protein
MLSAMELKSYLAVLSKRIWVILVTAALTVAITAAGSYYVLKPNYEASATVWVPTVGLSSATASAGDIMLGERLINTYAALSTSRPVLQQVSERLGISRRELREQIEVKFEPATELMYVTAKGENPQLAAEIATSVAESVIEQARRTKAGRDLRVSLFATAGVPDTPTWLGMFATPFWREINIGLGLIAGLIAGIGLAFLFEYLDTTLYTKEQIESVTQLATLGEIPIVEKQRQAALLTDDSFHGEAFRYLRTSLFFIDDQILPKTLLVTSAMPREGKSTIVANLAVAVAQSQRKVVVVDADLRLPSLHRVFGIPNDVGLSSILQQGLPVADALRESKIPGLRIITSGPVSSNPGRLLDLPGITTLIDDLKEQADLVLFDTPALLAVSDAAVLAPMVDGVVLVVGRAQTQEEAVHTARQHLASVGARLMGVVVNRANLDETSYHWYTSKTNSTAHG